MALPNPRALSLWILIVLVAALAAFYYFRTHSQGSAVPAGTPAPAMTDVEPDAGMAAPPTHEDGAAMDEHDGDADADADEPEIEEHDSGIEGEDTDAE